MAPGQFEPKIVAFLCDWCSYSGADMAGTARFHYPPTVRIIRTICSGRVDPSFVLKAFAQGADGVLIAGCHPGDCHHSSGNYMTMRRVPITRELLKGFGIDPRRLRLEWISAAEGARWAQVVQEMTRTIVTLGPLNWKGFLDFTRHEDSMLAEEQEDTVSAVWRCAEAGVGRGE